MVVILGCRQIRYRLGQIRGDRTSYLTHIVHVFKFLEILLSLSCDVGDLIGPLNHVPTVVVSRRVLSTMVL